MDSKDEIINGLDGTSDGWQTTFTHDEVKKAMDIHAKQRSIAFADWYYRITRMYVGFEDFGINHPEFMNNGKLKTTEQLYKLFESQSLNNIQP